MRDDLTKEVCDFLYDYIGKKFKDLNSNIADPKLFSIVSEDAIWIMEEYAEKFGVDLSSFVIDEYFLFIDYRWYDFIGMWSIYKLIYKRLPYDDVVLKPLTVNHLIAVAEKKKWFEPVCN